MSSSTKRGVSHLLCGVGGRVRGSKRRRRAEYGVNYNFCVWFLGRFLATLIHFGVRAYVDFLHTTTSALSGGGSGWGMERSRVGVRFVSCPRDVWLQNGRYDRVIVKLISRIFANVGGFWDPSSWRAVSVRGTPPREGRLKWLCSFCRNANKREQDTARPTHHCVGDTATNHRPYYQKYFPFCKSPHIVSQTWRYDQHCGMEFSLRLKS